MKRGGSTTARSIRRHLATGFVAIALLVGGVGSWAATAKISGAVVGIGAMVVEGDVKRVQHRDGGIVGEILVDDGDHVEAQDLLIRLDDTLTRANLGIVEDQILQLTASRMRLVAERDGAEPVVPDELAGRLDDPEVAALLQSERELYRSRLETLQAQTDQLRRQGEQIGQEIAGLEARQTANSEELQLVEDDLANVERLFEQDLAPVTRVTELRRSRSQLQGTAGEIQANIAAAQTRIIESQLQILQLEQDRRTEVLTDLRTLDGQLAELGERRIAALEQLAQVEIRAPQSGYIHQLAVHTIGGVVMPGETVLEIVPDNDDLVAEVRISPVDIDQVYVGQEAVLRIAAFNQRTTPELHATVATVSPDLTRNEQTGEAWYDVRFDIAQSEFDRLGGLDIVPGMPVDAFIATEERTALSYFLKPLSDQLVRAFREE